jgi:hypothetical protein
MNLCDNYNNNVVQEYNMIEIHKLDCLFFFKVVYTAQINKQNFVANVNIFIRVLMNYTNYILIYTRIILIRLINIIFLQLHFVLTI